MSRFNFKPWKDNILRLPGDWKANESKLWCKSSAMESH